VSLPLGITSTSKNAPTALRTAVVVACMLFVVLAAARIVVDRQLVSQLHGAARSGHHLSVLEQRRHFLVAWLWVGRLAIAVTLVAWLIPARRIVQGYDCGMFRSEPDTVISTFVLAPFSLPGPYEQVSDVWLAGHPARPPDAIIDSLRVPFRVVAWWWGFVGTVVLAILVYLFREQYSRDWTAAGARLDALVIGGQLLSAALLAWIVVDATRFIARRAEAASPL
jgi:hypothetical protein